MSATRPERGRPRSRRRSGPRSTWRRSTATSPARAQRDSSSAGSSGTPRRRRLARRRSPPAARASEADRGGVEVRGVQDRGGPLAARERRRDVVGPLHPRARQRRAARVLVLVPALHQHDGVRSRAAAPRTSDRRRARCRPRSRARSPPTRPARPARPRSRTARRSARPEESSSSSIAAQVAFASAAAAHADGAEDRSAEVGVDPARVDHAPHAQRVVERHPRHSERRRLRARRHPGHGWRPPRRLWFPPR